MTTMMDGPFNEGNLPKSPFVEEINLKHKSKGVIYTNTNKKLRSNFEVADLDQLTDEGSQYSLEENYQVDDMMATLKASTRSRGSNLESLPSITGRAPQTNRDNANNMIIEEIIEDEPAMEPLGTVRDKPKESKEPEFNKSEKDKE